MDVIQALKNQFKELILINIVLSLYLLLSWINPNYSYFSSIPQTLELYLAIFASSFIFLFIISSICFRFNKSKIILIPGIMTYIFYIRSPFKKIALTKVQILETIPHLHFIFDFFLFVLLFFVLKKIITKQVKVTYFIAYIALISSIDGAKFIYKKVTFMPKNKTWLKPPAKSFQEKIAGDKNIYFILLDSYAGFYASQLINATDSYNALKKELDKDGFKEVKNFFVDSNSTKSTMPTFFNGTNKIKSEQGKTEPFHSYYFNKSDISGSHVINFLKKNNYEINYVHGREYLIKCRGHESICYPKNSTMHHLGIISSLRFLGEQFFPSVEFTDSDEIVRKSFLTMSNTKEKQFYYLHFGGPGHVPHICFPFRSCDEKKELSNYKERVKILLPKVSEVLQKLKKNDPESIIIITSDHGPGIYDKFNVSASTKKHFISGQNGILFIKGLGEIQNDFKYITSKNLMSYVFNKTNGNNILNKLTKNEQLLTHCYSNWKTLKKRDLYNLRKFLSSTKTDCYSFPFNEIEGLLSH